ncbi:MAG: hypothetical protein NZ822_01140 [Patescibacteria group bacterium]|nr:hypothetical protein [Patescibacteria group bacterium]
MRGSLGQSIFFSFIFLSLFLFFLKRVDFFLPSWLIIALANYLILRKYPLIDWLFFILVLIMVGYLSFNGYVSLMGMIILSSLVVFVYAWSILKLDFWKVLTLTLIAFEIFFLANFLPLTFWLRTSFSLLAIFLLSRFANAIIKDNGISTNRS